MVMVGQVIGSRNCSPLFRSNSINALPIKLMSTTLGIIPARGGSKGVLRKNIRLVAGEPLIAYSIRSAQSSRRLTHLVVSTDDDEIASVARSYNAKVLLRPALLATDKTPMLPVVRHAFMELEEVYGFRFDYGVIMQPTSPMRTADDIDQILRILEQTGADSVVSVYRVFDHHPARMYRLENDRLIPLFAEPIGQLRQDLPPVYHRNGALYAFRREIIDEQDSLIGPDLRAYIMPEERSINIDNELDLLLASLMIEKMKSNVKDS
jgi:CMP-N-acetylneuraminic acid synthetase